MNLNQAQAEAAPYFYTFRTSAPAYNNDTKQYAPAVVTGESYVGTTRRGFTGASVAEVLGKINSYENSRVNRGLPTR